MLSEDAIRNKYEKLIPYLNEKTIRIWAAVEAGSIGRGGIMRISEATGLSRTTIYAGMSEINNEKENQRIRRNGGGRKKLKERDSTLTDDLENLVEPYTLGDPMSPLRWTCRSISNLTEELKNKGHKVSRSKVCELLHELDYSLKSNRKTDEGGGHPDRDEQFKYISGKVKSFQAEEQPVISVDTKKKENIGEYKNDGSERSGKGRLREVKVYDFPDKKLGKVVPYGVYGITSDKGWVNVGISSDTAEFAAESIRLRWYEMGGAVYPNAEKLLITADGGGSNGSRVKLWKREIRKLADEIGMEIHICHFPPGTSKRDKIEHRMFCHITQNWRGCPLISREVVVNLIGNTTTEKGLTIKAKTDERNYEKGIVVTDEELSSLSIDRDKFHGEWNYSIKPKQ